MITPGMRLAVVGLLVVCCAAAPRHPRELSNEGDGFDLASTTTATPTGPGSGRPANVNVGSGSGSGGGSGSNRMVTTAASMTDNGATTVAASTDAGQALQATNEGGEDDDLNLCDPSAPETCCLLPACGDCSGVCSTTPQPTTTLQCKPCTKLDGATPQLLCKMNASQIESIGDRCCKFLGFTLEKNCTGTTASNDQAVGKSTAAAQGGEPSPTTISTTAAAEITEQGTDEPSTVSTTAAAIESTIVPTVVTVGAEPTTSTVTSTAAADLTAADLSTEPTTTARAVEWGDGDDSPLPDDTLNDDDDRYNNVELTDDDAPPGNDDAPPGNDDAPPRNDDAPPRNDDAPPRDDDVPATTVEANSAADSTTQRPSCNTAAPLCVKARSDGGAKFFCGKGKKELIDKIRSRCCGFENFFMEQNCSRPTTSDMLDTPRPNDHYYQNGGGGGGAVEPPVKEGSSGTFILILLIIVVVAAVVYREEIKLYVSKSQGGAYTRPEMPNQAYERVPLAEDHDRDHHERED